MGKEVGKETKEQSKAIDSDSTLNNNNEGSKIISRDEEIFNTKESLRKAVLEENQEKVTELETKLNELQTSKINDVTSKTGKGNEKKPDFDAGAVLDKALKRAAGGGIAGATAMFIQVGSLMWMRTTMNYQYKYGTTTSQAIKKLYAEGGIRRFYRGIGPALFQGPLSRFGDTAANTGILAFLNSHPNTENLPVAVKTLAASGCAALWRIFLMPIDTFKTTLQVEGKNGMSNLMKKSRASGPLVFYHGALAASSATFAGHYPWFFTYNALDANLPVPDTTLAKLARNAFMGFTSSVVSDTTSNSIRVVKTFRQTNAESISYVDCVRQIVKEDGWLGLFGRGLKTRILANGAQGLMFSVLWKYFDEKFRKKSDK